MSSFELPFNRKSESESESERKKKELIERYEASRISADQVFKDMYSDYGNDMERVGSLEESYQSDESIVELGKIAEALVYHSLNKHEISRYLQFRPASRYDDLFKGTDILVEPKTRGSSNQAFAGIDVTINQGNLDRGVDPTRFSSEETSHLGGLETKLVRSRRYTDRLAAFDATKGRNLLAWLESGGLNQPKTRANQDIFDQAESVLAMKYYRAPETAPEPGKPGYVIGGPHPIISLDTYFINQALQGGQQAEGLLSDLAVVEFVMGIQAERDYLDKLVRVKKDRNVLFDKHYAKVKGWTYTFDDPALEKIVSDIVKKHRNNPSFQKQLNYFAQTYSRVNK